MSKRQLKRLDILRQSEASILFGVLEKFVRNIEKDDQCGCWVWRGALSSGDFRYGKVSVPRAMGLCSRTQGLSHRIMYQLVVGDIPEGMTVDHICFNTLCCNPAHLQLLTRGQNAGRRKSQYFNVPVHQPPILPKKRRTRHLTALQEEQTRKGHEAGMKADQIQRALTTDAQKVSLSTVRSYIQRIKEEGK